MAGKPVDMSKIKQVLQLSGNGTSNRQISKDLGINKETVNNYVRFFKSDSLTLKEALKLEDPELEARFRAGNPAYTDPRHETFLNELDKTVEFVPQISGQDVPVVSVEIVPLLLGN